MHACRVLLLRVSDKVADSEIPATHDDAEGGNANGATAAASQGARDDNAPTRKWEVAVDSEERGPVLSLCQLQARSP